jgi:hypothetical protein
LPLSHQPGDEFSRGIPSPEAAEQWAATIPAWRAAPDDARTAFAVTLLGVWEWLERSDPLPLRPPLTAAARYWVRYRMNAALAWM